MYVGNKNVKIKYTQKSHAYKRFVLMMDPQCNAQRKGVTEEKVYV